MKRFIAAVSILLVGAGIFLLFGDNIRQLFSAQPGSGWEGVTPVHVRRLPEIVRGGACFEVRPTDTEASTLCYPAGAELPPEGLFWARVKLSGSSLSGHTSVVSMTPIDQANMPALPKEKPRSTVQNFGDSPANGY